MGKFLKTGNIESTTLSMGHTLILPNKPTIARLPEVCENGFLQSPSDISKFGLFDSSTPNYVAYYPDATPEDFEAKDDEFIYPVYRALSAIVLPDWGGPISFELEDVLKASKDMLIGQSVYPHHESITGNELGSVHETSWQSSYTAKGIKVPAGILASLKIDAKSNPRISRGIMMDPPSIHSTSVSVAYKWDQSHPKLTPEDFRAKLGTRDEKNKLYRKIVAEILAYQEISLVPHGRDPYAQKTGKDGKIKNPEYGSRIQDITNTKHFSFDFKNAFKETETSSFNQITEPNMDELQSLIQALNLEIEPAQLQAHIEGIVANNATLTQNVADLTVANSTLSESVTALTGERDNAISELNALKEANDALSGFKPKEFIDEFRTKTLNMFKSLSQGEPDNKIISLINECNYEQLTALNLDYEARFNEKNPVTCTSCGSHDVSRQTSTEETETPDFVNKTSFQTMDEIRDNRRKANLKNSPVAKQ